MKPATRILAAAAALLAIFLPGLACAAWNSSSVAVGGAKAFHAPAFHGPEGAVGERAIELGPLPARAIAAVKSANGAAWNKRLQIGIGRDLGPEGVAALADWAPVVGGLASRWRLRSVGAHGLRIGLVAERLPPGVEMRFAGTAEPDTIYGPFTNEDLVPGEGSWWSPVLRGDAAIVELFVPDGLLPDALDLRFAHISHLFVHPLEPNAESLAKASGSCEQNLVCRSASDAALASAGKSVARMSFVIGTDGYLCTGTLLNPTGGVQTPYFYSANHCISTQAVASTLTTFWFFEANQCLGSSAPGALQLAGGAALLHASEPTDVLLLRLNSAPPAGAVFAAWDSTLLGVGTPVTAIHHPAGDLKKVSLGSKTGLGGPIELLANGFNRVDWTLGVTEGGSSGSGIFTAVGSPATEYRFRGGLWGGASQCGLPQAELYDFYSRLDLAYPSIAQYLSPASPPPVTYTLTVSKSGSGTGTVASNPSGIGCGATCNATYPSGTAVSLVAVPDAGARFSGWYGGCSGTSGCIVQMGGARTVGATFDVIQPPALTVSDTSLSFGNQLLNAASPAKTLILSNSGGDTLSFSGLVVTPGFGISHACTQVGVGGSCNVHVTFTPTALGAQAGTLTLVTNAGTQAVALSGVGQESLVSHYYQSILGRAGEAGGVAFWNAEALRIASQGANVNETWFAMAMSFFFSPEYVAFGRDDAGFLTDLYNTFFKRAPDPGGLAYWSGQVASGMPREVVLLSFMFSPEFTTFTQGLFGNTAARPEVDTVMDLYRGLLARLPDAVGLSFYVQQLRTAQCQGATAVYAQVRTISSGFANGAEYLGRNRSNAQFVSDLYNTFLRRGGELIGVLYWVNQLQTGAQTREQVRQAFINSPEFTARVNAIVARGCIN